MRKLIPSSGYQDSNLGSPGPKPGAITGLGHTPLKRGLNPYFLFQLASDRYQKASAKITIMLFSASTRKKSTLTLPKLSKSLR